ncbi:MAG TPA: CBS domain-containing protein [Verrucomicrobiae bacterium]|nr:CBS domain-containing protein [Verrucomicrobiae bacterium]
MLQPVARTIIPDVIQEQELATLPPSASVAAAIELMVSRRIGAVPVSDNGRLIGIFTERDVVTRVVSAGLDAAKTALRTVMTPDPAVLTPGDSVRSALDLMNRGHFRHLPVIGAGRLMGIVSIRDLYRSVVEQMESDIIMLAEGLLQG